jgi:hypothetical protein
VSYALKGGNPLWPLLQLFMGVLAALLSVSWLLQIALFVLPNKPVHPFLNSLFIALESAFGGTLLYHDRYSWTI